MKTRKQLEAALNRAENRVNEWYDRYLDELDCLYVRRKNGRYVSLLDKFGQSAASDTDTNPISQRISCDVYEEDDWRYRECTQRAIKRLRRIEDKINEWNDKCYYLDCAVDCWDELTGVPAYILRELENLNHGGTCRHDILTVKNVPPIRKS